LTVVVDPFVAGGSFATRPSARRQGVSTVISPVKLRRFDIEFAEVKANGHRQSL